MTGIMARTLVLVNVTGGGGDHPVSSWRDMKIKYEHHPIHSGLPAVRGFLIDDDHTSHCVRELIFGKVIPKLIVG